MIVASALTRILDFGWPVEAALVRASLRRGSGSMQICASSKERLEAPRLPIAPGEIVMLLYFGVDAIWRHRALSSSIGAERCPSLREDAR